MTKKLFSLLTLLLLLCSSAWGTNKTYKISAPDQKSYTDATSGITAVGTYTTAKIDNASSSKVFSTKSQQPLYITSINANIKGIEFDYVSSSSGSSGTVDNMNIYTSTSAALAIPTSDFTASYTPSGGDAEELNALSNIPVSKVQTSHYTFSLTLNSAVSTIVIATSSSAAANIRNISIIYDDAISAPSLYATITPSGTTNSWNVTSGGGSMAAAGITATEVTINDASYYKLDGTSTYTPAQPLIAGDVVVFNIGYTSSKTLGIKVPSSADPIVVDKGLANQPYQIVYVVPSNAATLSFTRNSANDHVKDIQVYHNNVEYDTYNVTYTSAKGVAPSSESDVYNVTLSEITGVSGWKNTGWIADKTTSVNSSDVSAGNEIENGSTVFLTDDTEFSAVWVQLYDVTKGTYTNGSFTISATKASAGETVTLTATPSFGYTFLGWQIVKTSGSEDITDLVSLSDATNPNATFKMPSYGVTINATFVAPNIYYYKDETHYVSDSYKNPEGGNPSGTDNTALTTPWTICAGCLTGITSVIATKAVYDNKGNHINSYIKLRKDDNGYIVFTIASGYKATIKIKMGGYSSTNTNITMKLNDAGDNITYSGTMSGKATDNNFAELTYANLAAGAYTLKPTSGSLYISQIDIQTASNTIPVTVTSAGWASFCSDKALDFTGGVSGITVYTVNGLKANGVTLNIEEVITHVPANTGLLIEGNAGTYNIPVVASSSTVLTNDLVAVTADDTDVEAADAGYTNYVLCQQNGKVVFAPIGAKKATLNKGQAYLQIATGELGAPSVIRLVDDENNATSVENIESAEQVHKFVQNGQLLILREGVTYDALGRIVK